MKQSATIRSNSSNSFDSGVRELRDSISICMQNKLLLPALILQYAAIDVVANLDSPEGKEGGTRTDFIRWTSDFLLPQSRLKITAEELYSARCGLLHAYSYSSGMTRRGEAREVFYSFGKADHQAFEWAASVGSRKFAAVKIEELISSFQVALERFQKALAEDASRASRVYERASKQFFARAMPSGLRGG